MFQKEVLSGVCSLANDLTINERLTLLPHKMIPMSSYQMMMINWSL